MNVFLEHFEQWAGTSHARFVELTMYKHINFGYWKKVLSGGNNLPKIVSFSAAKTKLKVAMVIPEFYNTLREHFRNHQRIIIAVIPQIS